MSSFLQWVISILVWLSSDPVAIDSAAPRAAAAVSVARASMAPDEAPAPSPAPADCGCGRTCVNGIWKPDGKIPQKCACPCERCKAARSCPDGKCPRA